jgi:hypothetical protein
LLSCENERKVHPKRKRNPPNGAAGELPNLLQQDDSLVDCSNGKGGGHQMGKHIISRLEA